MNGILFLLLVAFLDYALNDLVLRQMFHWQHYVVHEEPKTVLVIVTCSIDSQYTTYGGKTSALPTS